MTQQYTTVVPLNNVELPPETAISFSDDVSFGKVPDYIRTDKGWLDKLGDWQRDVLLSASHAFITKYDCEAIGERDTRWKGGTEKSKQNVKEDVITLANCEFSRTMDHLRP